MTTGVSRVERAVGRLVGFLERRPGLVALGTLVVAGLSVWGAMNLKVVQDLKVLLPADAPSISRLETLEAQMGNLHDLLVEIKSPSRDANIAFGEALSARLAARDDIRFSLFHQDRTYFEDHALLYLSVADLLDLRERVITRIQDEVAATFADGFEDDQRAPPKALDDELGGFSRDELSERYGIDEKIPEYFEADEGRVVVIKARPTHPNTDVAFTRALIAGLDAEVAALDPASFHPDLTVQVQGGYAKRNKDLRTIGGDAARGTVMAIILLIVCLFLYFRRLRAVPIVLVPLLLSIVTALGYAYLRFGFLNVVSAFIFAVLLGVGIDFGLHILGRYEAERGRGLDRRDALTLALSTTGMSTLAGAVSTIGVYGFLMVADFQGFAQFGELAAVGIAAAAIGVFVVLPAFIVLFERWVPWKPVRHQRVRVTPPARPPSLRLRVSAAIALALGVFWAAFSAWHAPDIEFEYNFNRLGPKPAAASAEPEEEAPDFRDAVGWVNTLGPVVAMTDSLAQTEWVHRLLTDAMELDADAAARFDEVRAGTYTAPTPPDAPPDDAPPDDAPPPSEATDEDETWGDDDETWGETEDPVFARLRASVAVPGRLSPESLARFEGYDAARVASMNASLVQVLSLFSFVPDRQDDKLVIIRDIRRRIDDKRGSLTEDTKKKLADTERYLAVDAPVVIEALPDWVRVQFTDNRGDLGRFVIFRNRGSMSDYLVAERIQSAFFDLETPMGDVASAGNVYIMPEMLDAVAADGPVVVSLAVLVVILTALALFRSLFGVGAVLLTVVLGVMGLVGVMELLDWKANFFNLIAIPLLLGMGQDYALHLYHRVRHDGVDRIRRVLRETGGAVFMTTLTTIIGFGGILFANHQGMLSLAWTAVVGLMACFAASVIMLPAIIIVWDWAFGRRGDG